ncbi:MAG: phospholipase D family protein [Pirellulales bacterium]|nr:phospholipase D family protein [Pirellulales bacterium]
MAHLPRRRRLPARVWLACAIAASAIIAGAPQGARGDVLRILQDDLEAIQARVDLIEQAQQQLDVVYFAVADDDLALAFLAMLRDASRRGVRVRLVVDGMYNDIPEPVQAHLLREGVEIREYHPIQCRHPFWINRRMHDKVLLADCSRMIVGSRNLDHRNFGLGCRNFVDRDAYVEGAIACCEGRRYFERLWASRDLRPTSTRKTHQVDDDNQCDPLYGLSRQLAACAITPGAALDEARCELFASGAIHPGVPDSWSAGQPHVCNLRFLSDGGELLRRHSEISETILELVAGAQESIILESPYLVISRHLDQALTQAQSRGVQVVILTNSLASTDQLMVYAGYSNQRKRLLARRVEVWEFAGCDHFHAKSALIDGCIAVIGSYNFDPRSEHLNTETAVVARDPYVADQLLDSMDAHFANSWRIGPDGNPIGADERHPRAGEKKIHQLRAARLLAPLIRRHL